MSVQPKIPGKSGPKYEGEMRGKGAPDKFAKPSDPYPQGIDDVGGTHNDIGEKSGFEADTSSYIDKKGIPYGEAAKLNLMPPGMDITNQEIADIREMKMKKVTSISYPGDGWESTTQDAA